MIEVTLAGALIAGLLSFLSPCVLPLVPAYLSYISGVSVNELRQQDGQGTLVRRRALMQSLWFVAGFSLVFIALGASATLMGQWMMAHMDILGKIAGAIIVVFGLHYTGLIRIPLLIIVGVMIFFGSFSIISGWLINWFPALADIESVFSPSAQ